MKCRTPLLHLATKIAGSIKWTSFKKSRMPIKWFIFRLTTESLSIEFMVILILTIPTSESSDIDKTNIETPTVTAGPKIWYACYLTFQTIKWNILPHTNFVILQSLWNKSRVLDVTSFAEGSSCRPWSVIRPVPAPTRV